MLNRFKEVKLEPLAIESLYLDSKKDYYKGMLIRTGSGSDDLPYYLTSSGQLCSKRIPGHKLPTMLNLGTFLNGVRVIRANGKRDWVSLEELIVKAFFKFPQDENGMKQEYNEEYHRIVHRDGNMFDTRPSNLKVIDKHDYDLYKDAVNTEIDEESPHYRIDLRQSSNSYPNRKILTNISLDEAADISGLDPRLIYLAASRSLKYEMDIEIRGFLFTPVDHTPVYQRSSSALDGHIYIVYDSKKRIARRKTSLTELAPLMSTSKASLEKLIREHMETKSSEMVTTKQGNENIELWLEQHFMAKHEKERDIVFKDDVK